MPTTLIAGLLVGLIGSFFDDLAGSSGFATAAQVVLWIASGVLVAAAIAALSRAPRGRTVAH